MSHQEMHLGRTMGLRGAGEHYRDLQDAAHCPLSSTLPVIVTGFISQFFEPFKMCQNNLSGWSASGMLVGLRHTWG